MQRLQFDLGEQISRKEYLKRKRRNSKLLLRKRSKITYILMAIFMALAIYIVVQVVIYRRYNNFKYTLDEGVNAQAIYNIYFVTEGYTYDPEYSISSITSLGENEKNILPASNIDNIIVEKDYIYGVKDGVICKVSKDKYEIEEIIKDDIRKFTKHGNTLIYVSGENGDLKTYNIETKEQKKFDLSSVEQILANDNNIFAVTHNTDEKAIYRFDYAGGGKEKISGDDKVSYSIIEDGTIYFVNRSDSNRVYRMDSNGQNKSGIGNIKSVSNNGPSDMINGGKYMFVRDGKLYYINPEDDDTLWCYDLVNNTNEKIISASIEILQNVDNTVFYKIDKEMGVYLYNYDTKFMSLVTKRRVKEFVIDTYTDMVQNVE